MTSAPYGFLSLLQQIAPPICQILRCNNGAGLIIAAQEGSFLDVIMSCIAAGAPQSVSITARPIGLFAGVAIADGVCLSDPDYSLQPIMTCTPRLLTSLDKLGLQLPAVAAIALDGVAMRARSWIGAKNLIQRDRPVLVCQIAGLRVEELAEIKDLGYEIKVFSMWSHPRECPIIAVATPRELTTSADAGSILVAPHFTSYSLEAKSHAIGLIDDIPASKLQASMGLYQPEYDNGRSWAWTGPTARTELLLPQLWIGSQKISLQIHKTSSSGGLESLRFYVNGKRNAMQVVGGGAVTIDIDVLAEDFTGTTKLTLITPEVKNGVGDDSRLLGTCLGNTTMKWN